MFNTLQANVLLGIHYWGVMLVSCQLSLMTWLVYAYGVINVIRNSQMCYRNICLYIITLIWKKHFSTKGGTTV